MTSALGSGSLKKSPGRGRPRGPAGRRRRWTAWRWARPPAGRRWCSAGAGACCARMIESWPVAPPTSQSVLYWEKSNFSARALEVDAREAGHRVHELFEAGGVGVELLEHRPAGVLDLVLRSAGAQRLGQVAPEPVQPRVEHLQDAADVPRARLVEERRGRGGVGGTAQPSPEPSRRAARSATRPSRKSNTARERRCSVPASSSAVLAPVPRAVNRPSSTAVSSVLDGQNPIPTCMISDGSGTSTGRVLGHRPSATSVIGSCLLPRHARWSPDRCPRSCQRR